MKRSTVSHCLNEFHRIYQHLKQFCRLFVSPTNQVLDDSDKAIEEQMIDEDEAFEEDSILALPTDIVDVNEETTIQEDDIVDSQATGRKGIPGLGKVDRFAQALLKATGLSVSDAEAEKIVILYNDLEDYDKQAI